MLSPLFPVGPVMVLTRPVAKFGAEGLAGYGIGVRLVFLLLPIAFSIGVASVPMVGTALGSGNLDRARTIAWRSGALAFAVLPGPLVDLYTDAASGGAASYAHVGIAG